jgi:hypothetical protein
MCYSSMDFCVTNYIRSTYDTLVRIKCVICDTKDHTSVTHWVYLKKYVAVDIF